MWNSFNLFFLIFAFTLPHLLSFFSTSQIQNSNNSPLLHPTSSSHISLLSWSTLSFLSLRSWIFLMSSKSFDSSVREKGLCGWVVGLNTWHKLLSHTWKKTDCWVLLPSCPGTDTHKKTKNWKSSKVIRLAIETVWHHYKGNEPLFLLRTHTTEWLPTCTQLLCPTSNVPPVGSSVALQLCKEVWKILPGLVLPVECLWTADVWPYP